MSGSCAGWPDPTADPLASRRRAGDSRRTQTAEFPDAARPPEPHHRRGWSAGRERFGPRIEVRHHRPDRRPALHRLRRDTRRCARHARDRASRPRQIGAGRGCAGAVGRQRLRPRRGAGSHGCAARTGQGVRSLLGPRAHRARGDHLRPLERRREAMDREPLSGPGRPRARRRRHDLCHRHPRGRRGRADGAAQGRAWVGVAGAGGRHHGGRACRGEPDGKRDDLFGQALPCGALRSGCRVRWPRPGPPAVAGVAA